MNSKILIIAIAIAVIATVFMGCAKDNMESEASSAVSKAGEKADKVGDDIGKGADDVADGIGSGVDKAGDAVSDALD